INSLLPWRGRNGALRRPDIAARCPYQDVIVECEIAIAKAHYLFQKFPASTNFRERFLIVRCSPCSGGSRLGIRRRLVRPAVANDTNSSAEFYATPPAD